MEGTCSCGETRPKPVGLPPQIAADCRLKPASTNTTTCYTFPPTQSWKMILTVQSQSFP